MPYNWNNYNRPKKKKENNRLDHKAGHRMTYERNKKRILATQEACGICGMPVDKTLKYPDPYSPTIDHIIPVSKGGHPSDINNLQLAHFKCNRLKSDKIKIDVQKIKQNQIGEKSVYDPNDPKGLPLSIDWTRYRAGESHSNSNELIKEAEEIRNKGVIITSRGIVSKYKV